ncbi:MAG: site-specific DNA-methyltransferase [Bryobacteraceae bacterium]|nr:site-specific DNA-methyltransferase [Bryobacteraceae bacterium]
MKPLTAQDPETQSPDLVTENVGRLKELFPEAFTEGRIDFDVLKQLLGGTVDEREEKYGLNWHGKRRARQLALTPSTGTLRPCPEESVDWETTHNLMIEGDNLEVLKLLQKSYAGKVRLIYIDPPYNTGKDFVYPDDYQDSIKNYLKITGQVDGDGRKLSSNAESSGRFHTDWLNMMYPRLSLARNLLSEEGVCFVSIDDHEATNLKSLCSEIFGEENFIITIVWEKGRKNDSTFFSETVEYMHVYAKSKESLAKLGGWREKKPGLGVILEHYNKLRAQYGDDHSSIEESMRRFYDGLEQVDPSKKLKHFWRSDARGLYFGADISSASTSIPDYEVIHPHTKKPCKKPSRGWGCNPDEMEKRIADDRVCFGNDESTIPLKKSYLLEVDSIVKTPVIYKDGRAASLTLKNLLGAGIFENPKDHLVLADLINYAAPSDALVVDFFAGSGSTAHAAWAQNVADAGKRRFLVVQLPEPLDIEDKDQKLAAALCDKLGKPRTICELTKERLRRAAKALRDECPMFAGDLGFRVFKLASSNIRTWEPNREDLPKTLQESVDHVKAGRTDEDVLFELLLKLGLDLTVPMENKTIAGKTVHSIGAGTLLACMATDIAAAEVEPLALGIVEWHKALAPAGETTIVFRDSAFDDDVAKTNLTAILQQHGLDNVRSL